MPCDSRAFFLQYFHELENRGIPYVILHSYEEFPDTVSSDVDYAVRDGDLDKIPQILQEVARRTGWVHAQTLRHQICAYYSVVIDPQNPRNHIKLDVSSHYVKDGCFLLRDGDLLGDRQPLRGFYIPASAAEFIYVLAKIFGKNKEPSNFLPRLRELYSEDPQGAQTRFTKLFGADAGKVEDWFERPATEWSRLNGTMRARNRYTPALYARELRRISQRGLHPAGLCIVVLGPDGAGKSTLLENLWPLTEPCFRNRRFFHFRPQLFEKKGGEVVTDPHGQSPRSLFMSLLKLCYYFADQWLGWLCLVLPSKIRSTLVIFDRNFDDMLVDQKRYRLNAPAWLLRLMSALLPKADLVFVLDASPEIIHARKPELPLDELQRQRAVLRSLAARKPHAVLINAEDPPDKVAATVARAVIERVAERCKGNQ